MKTCAIYHSQDLDGWMSAAIVKHWFKTTIEPKNRLLSSNHLFNTIDFVGYNYGQPIPDLSEYDKVIMCDISFPAKVMKDLHIKLTSIPKESSNFIWLDHHISTITAIENEYPIGDSIPIAMPFGFRDTNYAACELTWKYFFPNETMPEIVRLLGRYDCFGHKGTDEEQKVLEFQYGARMVISNYEQAYDFLTSNLNIGNSVCDSIHIDGAAIYRYLCTEAKQVYKNGFEITLQEAFVGLWGSGKDNRKFICINKERFNPINFGIDYHSEGYDGCACFHYANGMYNFSLYNDNGLVDCSVIAKQYGGGSHKGAAGFRLSKEEFNTLIK